MGYAWRVSAAPSVEPVSLAEATAHLRVDFQDDDAYIRALIVAAREQCELRTRAAFIAQTHILNLDHFPGAVLEEALIFGGDPIYLPRSPVLSVTSVQYVDDQGTLTVLPTAAYQTDIYSHTPRIKPAYGYTWPTTRAGVANAVTVTYQAGYGPDPDDVPEGIRQAIKILVGTWYENRESVAVGSVSIVPMSVGYLLAPYTRGEVLS